MNHTTSGQFASIQKLLRELPRELSSSLDAIWQSNQTPYQQLINIARLARHDARIAEIVTILIPLRLAAAPLAERRAVEAELARATGGQAAERPPRRSAQPLPRPSDQAAAPSPRPAAWPPTRQDEPSWPGEGPDPRARHTPDPDPIEIRIDPEIARLAVALRRDPELRLWMVLRHVAGASGGRLDADELYQRICRIVTDYTRRHFNRLLKSGAGTFWTIDGDRQVWLWGGAALGKHLVELAGPELVSSNPPGARDMFIPIGKNIQQFRAHCLGAWYAHRENPTLSRMTLEMLWGRDADTLRRWEDLIIASPNHQLFRRENTADLITNQNNAHLVPCALDNPSVRQGYTWDGRPLVSWRIPNTYVVFGYRQAPKRGRGRQRRQAALDLLQQLPVIAGQSPALSGAGRKRIYWNDGKHLEAHNRRNDRPANALVFIGEDRHGARHWALTDGRPEIGPNALARGRMAFKHITDGQARWRSFRSKCAQDIFAVHDSGQTHDYAKAVLRERPALGVGGCQGGGGYPHA